MFVTRIRIVNKVFHRQIEPPKVNDFNFRGVGLRIDSLYGQRPVRELLVEFPGTAVLAVFDFKTKCSEFVAYSVTSSPVFVGFSLLTFSK